MTQIGTTRSIDPYILERSFSGMVDVLELRLQEEIDSGYKAGLPIDEAHRVIHRMQSQGSNSKQSGAIEQFREELQYYASTGYYARRE